MSVTGDEPLESEAEELFARWLASRDEGRPVEFETLAGGRTDLLEALRGLEAFWSQLEAVGGLDAALESSQDARAPSRDGAQLASAERVLADDEPATERYRVQREVGRGGMGVVFEVEDQRLHRHLAMKVVRAAPGAAGDRALTRFLDEAQVTAQLEHPAIVPVHELGRDDQGRAYFTMALVEGRTLSAVIERLHDPLDEEWSLPRVLDAVAKAAEAVAYAHSRGVVHRDLKPDNIMVGSFGRVFVMDWGLAQVKSKRRVEKERSDGANGRASLETDQPFLTHDGDVVGTPAYMPPEQAFGQLDRQGPRCDVYALGAILYHVVCGRAPYADRQEGTLAALRHGAPTPLLALDPRHGRELVAIIELAMRRDASKRYADVGALVADLRAFLEGRVVDAYESGAIARARKWLLRHRALAGLAVALVIAFALIGVANYTRYEKERLAGRFMDLERLNDLEVRADALWPAGPERARELDEFAEQGRAFAARLPGIEDELAGLEARSTTGAWVLAKRRELARRLADFADPTGGTLAAVERRASRAASIARIARVHSPRDDTERRALARGLLPLEPADTPFGPRRRYESLATASLERLERLADSSETRTGDPFDDALDGRAHRGVVLVELVPEDFDVLADTPLLERTDPDLDPRAIQPVLVAETELSCDQWNRLAEDGSAGELPIVSVSFERALEVLARGGLTLPTKYQWIAAARARSNGHWWFELDPALFDGDRARDPDAVAAAFLEREVLSPSPDARLDGPLPVGSRRANPLGLFDVLGNVRELLLDPFHRTQEAIWRYDPAAWSEVRGVTRCATDAWFRMCPGEDSEREFLHLDIAFEIGEASSDPYTGVRPVAALP